MRHTVSNRHAEFHRLAEGHRDALRAHCHRTLRSSHDADDAVQETLLRAWRGLPRFGGRSSLRTWLFRIATNVCLDMIRWRQRTSEVPQGGHVWADPSSDEAIEVATEDRATPDARYERHESLEQAFVAALEHLPLRQRTVLVLRDGLGFAAKEAAEVLGTTVPSVNGALSRARTAARERVPDEHRQAAPPSLGDREVRVAAERFADAFERGDVGTVLEVLAA